jgi:hypothetical protein
MMAKNDKKPTREQKITRMSIRWTVVLVVIATIGGFLVGVAEVAQLIWLRAIGSVLALGYVVGFMIFVVRYQQALDEQVRQRNLEAAAIGMVMLVFSTLIYLLGDLFGMNLPNLSVYFLLYYAMTLYLLSYMVLWWRSR